MNKQEKSLALAKLMGWELEEFSVYGETFDAIREDSSGYDFVCRESFCYLPRLEPYTHSEEGLAQFAAILLKFPEVMSIIVDYEESMWAYTYNQSDLYLGNRHKVRPTQANILDEILTLHGIEL